MQARREAPVMKDTVGGGVHGWAGPPDAYGHQGAGATTVRAVPGVQGRFGEAQNMGTLLRYEQAPAAAIAADAFMRFLLPIAPFQLWTS